MKAYTDIEQSKKLVEILSTEDDLLLYKDLGNGLYKLPGNIITNKKGKNEFLEALKNKINESR